MSDKDKVKTIVRIFEDGRAEALEGESLESFKRIFLDREKSAVLSLLAIQRRVQPKMDKVKWEAVKSMKIMR